MSPKKPSMLVMSSMIILVLAILLMVISIFPDWASFDRSRSIGPVDYRLQANFDPVGFDYKMETTGSSGGDDPLGGIGGGIAGNFSRSDSKTYPQVRGEFLDNIGIIYDSYRTKAFQYELKMRSPPQDSGITWSEVGNPSAILNTSLESDLIPWWPDNGKRTLTVRIELVEADLWDEVGKTGQDKLHVQVNSVQVWAKTGYVKETGEYTGEDRKLGEKEDILSFHRLGDESKMEFSIAYPDGTDAAGFYVRIAGNMTDYWGRPELSPLSGKANPINIYPLSTGKLVQGFGIPMALPLMIIASILGLVAIVIALFKGKLSLALMIPAGVLSLLAPLWFMIGMNAAVDLLSERLIGASEGLTYQAGIYISFAASILVLASVVLTVIAVVRTGKDGGTKITEPDDGSSPVFRKIGGKEEGTDDTVPGQFRRIDPPS